MSGQPLLGATADVKAPGSTSGWKASVALTLSVLAVGAICYPQGRIQDVSNSNLQLDATELIGRNTSTAFRGQRDTSMDTGRDALKSITSTAATDGPTEIPPDVVKEAVRDFTGIQGGARCVAAFLFDRDASRACESANPALVSAVTVVLSLYVLFFFAPFYMFPEAAVALYAWLTFPTLQKAIMVSPKDENVPNTMRMGLLVTALVAFISRLFTLWKERNEPIAAGRQSSMLWSLVIGFIIYIIFNFLSA
jgi:hypothetical protein